MGKVKPFFSKYMPSILAPSCKTLPGSLSFPLLLPPAPPWSLIFSWARGSTNCGWFRSTHPLTNQLVRCDDCWPAGQWEQITAELAVRHFPTLGTLYWRLFTKASIFNKLKSMFTVLEPLVSLPNLATIRYQKLLEGNWKTDSTSLLGERSNPCRKSWCREQ